MLNQLFRQNHSITLEQMKVFIHVYELESISLAANVSHKTQPAITHQLNQLEKKLHTKLIKRNRGRTIKFTEEGHRFYQKITPIVGQLLTQLDEIENKKTISIGICDDLAIETQMEICHQVSQQTDNRVRLLCDFSCRLQDMVADGRLSFAIVKKIIPHNQRLKHPFYWVAHQKVCFNAQQKMAIVSAHQGCFVRDVLEQVLNQADKDFYFSYLANNLASQAQAIDAGLGVGILDGRWLADYPNLVVVGETEGFPTLPSFQYHCIGEADTKNKKTVQEILHKIVDDLMYDGKYLEG